MGRNERDDFRSMAFRNFPLEFRTELDTADPRCLYEAVPLIASWTGHSEQSVLLNVLSTIRFRCETSLSVADVLDRTEKGDKGLSEWILAAVVLRAELESETQDRKVALIVEEILDQRSRGLRIQDETSDKVDNLWSERYAMSSLESGMAAANALLCYRRYVVDRKSSDAQTLLARAHEAILYQTRSWKNADAKLRWILTRRDSYSLPVLIDAIMTYPMFPCA